jgi:hypothetical protein
MYPFSPLNLNLFKPLRKQKNKKNLEKINISWKVLLGIFMQKTKGEEPMHTS